MYEVPVLVVCGMALAAAICTYLNTSCDRDQTEGGGTFAWVRAVAAKLDRRGCFKLASAVSALAEPTLFREAASLCKVVLGFFQLIQVFHRFDYVMWPAAFKRFLELFDVLQLEFEIFQRCRFKQDSNWV